MNKKAEAVQAGIRSALDKDGQIRCAAAHRIAESLGVEAKYVGEQADDMGIRITRCQLGLFGYAAKKGMPGYRLVKRFDDPPKAASASVRKAAVQGQISCLTLWHLAGQHELSKLDMANIAETLELKVTPCQLGCF